MLYNKSNKYHKDVSYYNPNSTEPRKGEGLEKKTNAEHSKGKKLKKKSTRKHKNKYGNYIRFFLILFTAKMPKIVK